MLKRLNCRILLLIVIAAVAYSQGAPSGSSDPKSPVAQPVKIPASVKQEKTNGIIGTLTKALWPLTELFLQMLQSYLKNMYGQSLPCRLESFTPLKGECTKLKQK